jgi:hypothetical protein
VLVAWAALRWLKLLAVRATRSPEDR